MERNPVRALKRGLPPVHPGEYLREVTLPALKQDQAIGKEAFAERLGISRQMLGKLTREASDVTPEMALRLGRVLGTTPEFWMNLQRDFDLARAEAALADELKTLRPVPASQAA